MSSRENNGADSLFEHIVSKLEETKHDKKAAYSWIGDHENGILDPNAIVRAQQHQQRNGSEIECLHVTYDSFPETEQTEHKTQLHRNENHDRTVLSPLPCVCSLCKCGRHKCPIHSAYRRLSKPETFQTATVSHVVSQPAGSNCRVQEC